jgi:hypothetical protein
VFQDQIQAFIETQDSNYTRQRYAAALAEFMAWYANNYADEPDAALPGAKPESGCGWSWAVAMALCSSMRLPYRH